MQRSPDCSTPGILERSIPAILLRSSIGVSGGKSEKFKIYVQVLNNFGMELLEVNGKKIGDYVT